MTFRKYLKVYLSDETIYAKYSLNYILVANQHVSRDHQPVRINLNLGGEKKV